MELMFCNYFSPKGAVFDDSTRKVLVVQDRNKVSCSYLVDCFLDILLREKDHVEEMLSWLKEY